MSKTLFFPKPIGIKYNSINLQDKLLADILQRELDVEIKYTDNPMAVAKHYKLLHSFGSFYPRLMFTGSLKNVIFVYHNITPAKYFWKSEPLVALRAVMARVQLWLMRFKSAQWVAVSEYNKKELEHFGIRNVHLCPNIILKKDIDFVEKTRVPSILYVGRIVQNKGCLEMLDVIEHLLSLYNNPIEFRVVGKGKVSSSYYKQFDKRISEINKCSNISIIWEKDVDEKRLAHLYMTSWLYISLSKHEGFGLPACESVSYGTPSIYTKSGGQEWVLQNYGLVEEENMSKTIYDLFLNEGMRNELYEKQRLVISDYLSPQIDNKIKSVYHDLI